MPVLYQHSSDASWCLVLPAWKGNVQSDHYVVTGESARWFAFSSVHLLRLCCVFHDNQGLTILFPDHLTHAGHSTVGLKDHVRRLRHKMIRKCKAWKRISMHIFFPWGSWITFPFPQYSNGPIATPLVSATMVLKSIKCLSESVICQYFTLPHQFQVDSLGVLGIPPGMTIIVGHSYLFLGIPTHSQGFLPIPRESTRNKIVIGHSQGFLPIPRDSYPFLGIPTYS